MIARIEGKENKEITITHKDINNEAKSAQIWINDRACDDSKYGIDVGRW